MRGMRATVSPARRSALAAVLGLAAAVLAAVAGVPRERAAADAATNGSFFFGNTAGAPVTALTVTEGQTACINIHRSGGTAGLQQVQVTVSPAASPDVGGLVSAFVNFSPGQVNRTIDYPGLPGTCLQTIDNAVVDGTRNLTFTIAGVTGGGVVGSPNSFTLTILDNDGPPKYSFQSATSSVVEGNPTHQVAVVREGSTAGTDSVTCQLDSPAGTATEGTGNDYTFSNQTITFNPGETGPKYCNVSILDDGLNEGNETINLKLVSSSGFGGGAGTPTTHTVTIVDNDGPGTLQFTSATYTVSEGAGTASIAVTRIDGSTGAASVQCTISAGTATPGSDYTATTPQTLSWTSGDASPKPCVITILQDTVLDGPKTINLSLSGATGATLGTPTTAVLTILDDDGTGVIQFTSATYTGSEAGGPITITVSRTGGTVGTVTVDYATSPGGSNPATPGVDYIAVSGTLTWADGEGGTKSFTVTPIPDTAPEGTETVTLTLSNPTGGATLGSPNTATLQISDSTSIPVITSIVPNVGPTAGGQTVTINGQNFTGATSVTFGGTPCTSFTVVSATQITCVTPPKPAGVVEVVVTTPVGSNVTTGTANDYLYTSGPTVLSLTPSEGACNGATVVTVTGTGFTPSGMTVTFGTVQAVFTYISSTTLVAVAPVQGAGVVDVRVTTPAGTSPNTAADDFTCTGTPIPTVTGLNPTSGPIGTTVTITGTNFVGVTSVTFGGVSATFTVVSSTQITATVPAGTPSGVVDVRVTNAAGTSPNTSADNFTNTSASTIQYTLYRTFTLIVWTGADNKPIAQAIGGTQAGTTNVSSLIGAIWLFNPQTQTWRGYFPGTENVPGANDFTTFRAGTAYFIALRPTAPATVSWVAPAN
ncbi:Calx-beta domain-containing protein [Tepidiforma thermophila]|uniref:IPT/TIG domain-containing protein n=1 Tax=Tepidiforma thermophila (strain KCTC 52669 / CGMCC 1.13589 / G233) TaxID=2761530 RepID=A0A2A9HJH6_TEPT2|nr:Calx-beta domain-containing protein [Tepidiforma thermophila]PFG75322.1 IPT/TIG domain-containing protein [Tepidiforma thermophila]